MPGPADLPFMQTRNCACREVSYGIQQIPSGHNDTLLYGTNRRPSLGATLTQCTASCRAKLRGQWRVRGSTQL